MAQYPFSPTQHTSSSSSKVAESYQRYRHNLTFSACVCSACVAGYLIRVIRVRVRAGYLIRAFAFDLAMAFHSPLPCSSSCCRNTLCSSALQQLLLLIAGTVHSRPSSTGGRAKGSFPRLTCTAFLHRQGQSPSMKAMHGSYHIVEGIPVAANSALDLASKCSRVSDATGGGSSAPRLSFN